jgi:hypothetical protein
MESPEGMAMPPIANIHQDGKLYAIRHSNGKGKGVFATVPIPRGTLILAETPIFRIPHGGYTPAIVHAVFDKLTNDAKQDFMALNSVHNLVMPHPSEKHPNLTGVAKEAAEGAWAARCGREKGIYSIFLGNSMTSNEGAAVFRECSRINHSCVPNCTFIWRTAEGREHIRAVQDIKAGEVSFLASL